ncbi:MAG: ATP-binding cassette domain-containing protein [Proteobacteria bacterium]|nr:ATP-binding cassette domain-containing protein [Pseudomonadota bacterium]
MDSPVSREQHLVTVEGVSFNFRTNRVLVEVSLSIIRGDFLAIIGPNVSGKRTLIEIILGLLSAKGFPRLTSRRDEHGIDRALDQVDMLALKHRRIGELSGGQQQQVFIARAIVNNPEILFLDEPTTGVDADTRDRFYDMLDSLTRNNGVTIALISNRGHRSLDFGHSGRGGYYRRGPLLRRSVLPHLRS